MDRELRTHELIALVAVIGVVIGVGKLLESKEPLTWRLAIGRAVVSAGLAVSAASLLAFIPGLGQAALIGLAAALSVLGEQFLERILKAKAGIAAS